MMLHSQTAWWGLMTLCLRSGNGPCLTYSALLLHSQLQGLHLQQLVLQWSHTTGCHSANHPPQGLASSSAVATQY